MLFFKKTVLNCHGDGFEVGMLAEQLPNGGNYCIQGFFAPEIDLVDSVGIGIPCPVHIPIFGTVGVVNRAVPYPEFHCVSKQVVLEIFRINDIPHTVCLVELIAVISRVQVELISCI